VRASVAVPDHSRLVNRFKEKYPFVEVSLIRLGSARKEASLMIYSLLITRVVILSLASMSPGASAAPARRE